MKYGATKKIVLAIFLLIGSVACASTTWYVNGVSGSDTNNCTSATTACKTIGHAISLAASGDTIKVAAATYTENLTIVISLRILGAGGKTTIVDGGGHGTVVTISNAGAAVTLSSITIRSGYVSCSGPCFALGGGIYNSGKLTLANSAVTNNEVSVACSIKYCRAYAYGAGIYNIGTVTVLKSTVAANLSKSIGWGFGLGGGISNSGTAIITNSTISGNAAGSGGGTVSFGGMMNINNTTISGNAAALSLSGGIATCCGYPVVLQNTIVADNQAGENCSGDITSNGYNLSSDGSCALSGPGDLNNTDPQLGPLKYNGGPTQTMALPSGSPAVDAGNPSGCTDNLSHLLKTDQRGAPRPDPEDTGGCDIGAYERQSD